MINKRKVIVEENESVECDVCHQTYGYDSEPYEMQEILHIDFVGGYQSTFGDMSRVQCDICQYCLKELLGKYLRVEEN
jgi:hypothetical protein